MKHSFVRVFRGLSAVSRHQPEEPIRSELFSIERLEHHAESLAVEQRVSSKPGRGRPLALRLRDNEKVLLAAYRAIGVAIREERAITPAAEWLVDNFHIAEEQIREIRDDLPSGYYRQLPKLAAGPLQGYPRVFGIAWAFVAHTDSLFDPQTLCRFLSAYQRVQPLTIGELWAVAITLRILLVENLRRAAEQIVSSRAARQKADALADRILGGGDDGVEATASARRSFEQKKLPRPFAVQLVQRLRDQDPAVTPALRWLDESLAAQGTSADDIVREEHQRQGKMNVTVRNVITSMRLVSAVDWADLFESVSLADAMLRDGSDFAAMDFPTRDLYRNALEELARGSGLTELEVAQRALLATERAKLGRGDRDVAIDRERDPGYHLIAKGRRAFEREIGFRIPIGQWLARSYTATGMPGYLATIAVVTGGILGLALWGPSLLGVGAAALGWLAVLALIPASDAAVVLVNHHVTSRLGPRVLPGMSLRGGVPPDLHTMVAVPTLLTTPAAIEEQIENLEVHHLANPQDAFTFALLSDWTDSSAESAIEDDELLAVATAGIARLNRRYGTGVHTERFLLLHRRRVWNEGEQKWIGWERKRGKLHELNRLLRGATDTTFTTANEATAAAVAGVRYVLTLDADTRLPRDAARRLVGKMAHPLNRPMLDARTQRVTEGYSILQPRVTPALPMGREGSLFQRLYSGPGGIDPYAFAVSDVYQDLLGEGSYTGKGIYDVDAFEAALAGRIPESTVLSHDLLESVFARAALVTDIEIVEEFPSRYDVAAARQHRWARGDWQLIPWILGRGRSAISDPARKAIPFAGRWKMLDNLRRTLVMPATFLALLAGWLTAPLNAAAVWTTAVIVIIGLPAILPAVAGIVPRRRGFSKRSYARNLGEDFGRALSQIAFLITFLAHQAWLMTDAMVRTLWRLCATHRHLLEWTTAAQAKFSSPLDVRGFYTSMAGGVALAGLAAALVAVAAPGALAIAAPLLLVWLLSPVVAQWSSRPPPLLGPTPLSAANAQVLRLIARRTWGFFDKFVTAEDNHLPPDNFQEDPSPVVAHRTSPTNLGLYLLSVVTARDFGWLGTLDTADRLSATLATMNDLERYRGHFYNWYDTRDLRALDPRYVSSVDSGNLAGHLLTLANACREMAGRPVVDPRRLEGIEDALALTRAGLATLPDGRRTQTVTRRQLEETLDALTAALTAVPKTASELARQVTALGLHGDTLVDIAQTLSEERSDDASASVLTWAEAVRASIRSHARDVDELIPWAHLFSPEVGSDEQAVADTAMRAELDSIPALADLPDFCASAIAAATARRIEIAANGDGADRRIARIDQWIRAFERSQRAAIDLERRLLALAESAGRMFTAMEFGFLLDPARRILSIGYQVTEGSLDPNCYDLLASEARLASFIAIAKGDVPATHWFRLGRALTPVDRGSALISWSGSMFEYLMPSLVMRAPAGSLLEQTSRFIVRRQIRYGAEIGVPWGVSESAYNARDLELTYQYSNFGVPGLGLKRGLSEDAVIAPYATGLAAMVDARAAVENYARLDAAGGSGRYGFYEALDYTPTRLPAGESVAVVRAYMAHHQGMTLTSIANTLHNGIMRARFHAEPIIQATELLLQERMPRGVAVARPRAEEVRAAADVRELVPQVLRRSHSPHDLVPHTHLLSNGRYSVMLTAAGSGYSRWRDLAVTRWREDVTCDSWGTYVFLRDARSGSVWSTGYQPSGSEPDTYEVEFAEDRAAIMRRDGTIATTLEVAVSAEDDAELRRVSISNLGRHAREIDVTSYTEVVLASAAADAAHPAFSKLFVETEFVAAPGALLATRRRRAPEDPEIWAAHLAVVEGETVGDLQFETDRARFLGRGHELATALSVTDGRALSRHVGPVLDPIFSLRHRVRIAPGATARVTFWTLVAPTRRAALDLADKHCDAAAFDRAVTLAWTQAQVQLHHLGCLPDEAYLFQRLANHVIYANPALRPPSAILQRNDRGQSSLWAHAISGDLPIVLVRIDEAEDLDLVRQVLRAHQYWRLKRLAVDLVILNERTASYAQDLQASLEALIRTSQARSHSEAEGAGGNVLALRADQLSAEARTLLQSAARAVLVSRRGSLSAQLKHLEEARDAGGAVSPRVAPLAFANKAAADYPRSPGAPRAAAELEFFNGLGGFTAGGREYTTVLEEGQWTPAPWINVIANPCFGFQVSVEGGGYTWSSNSRERQLTPWSNDPVGDRPGEAMYVRDEDTGTLWSPTALPIREDVGSYVARHGQGYSRFEHTAHGINLELLQYVPLEDPIKISRLTIRNHSQRPRRLSVTAYIEWVLGNSRSAAAQFVATEVDVESKVMLARNPWSEELGGRVAFADLAGTQVAWTGDRTEFLGRNGTLAHPAALASRAGLSNRVGAGFDPCGVLQTPVLLEPNGKKEITFFLGDAATRADAIALAARYRATDLDQILATVTDRWDEILGAVQVKTPDRAMDIVLNRWLLYQTLACRVLARSAFYQASGAYGFRDQLQDNMALAVTQPALTRAHLLRAAARQFVEGDVQHWWLPPTGRGVRTRISDGRVWLAYAAAHYVQVSGDCAVLDEMIPFLDGPPLRPDEHDSYYQPTVSEEHATLFEHCARALDVSLSVGAHGLPPIGSGDWNDGMNRVGEAGQGESVWLAWFLHAALSVFAPLAEVRGEAARANAWRQHASALSEAIDREAWDGEWYRRAYYDDGTPLGSSTSDECRIDSIAQSWAVISGAGDPARAARAMAAVDQHLVSRGDGLVLLFSPPFARTSREPGYIKAYPPGIRENGGQYTHAATWAVIAFAMLGDGDKAAELFAMLNPIHHASSRAASHRYKVEPYVASADVYSQPPHVGRGGWTWYTGSAGWLYRAGLEWILGFRVQGSTLLVDPSVPRAWPGFAITFRHRSAVYQIEVDNPHGVSRGVTRVELDDAILPVEHARARIDLVDDGATHRVRISLG